MPSPRGDKTLLRPFENSNTVPPVDRGLQQGEVCVGVLCACRGERCIPCPSGEGCERPGRREALTGGLAG